MSGDHADSGRDMGQVGDGASRDGLRASGMAVKYFTGRTGIVTCYPQ